MIMTVMKMIKCIASDLDGTLLYKGLLSDNNKKAIQMIQEKGIEFIIATGRDFSQTKHLFDEFGFSCDSILLNGTCFINSKLEVEFTIGLEKESVRQACELVLNKGLGIMFYTKDKVVCFKNKALVCEDFSAALFEYSKDIVTYEFYEAIEEYHDLDEMMAQGPLSCEIMSRNGELVEEVKEELKKIEGIDVTSSIPKEVEFTSIHASKGKALQKVCELKGYKQDEVVVFGDGGNDISLFECFDRAYAMGNADPVIKKVAKHTCLNCEEDGFYHKVMELLEEDNG